MNKFEKHLRYFELFPLLDYLETKRQGIRDRVWKFLCEDKDVQFAAINNRIMHMNLYFYGVGDEYPIESVTKIDINHCKSIHPEAFIDGTKENELRKDFNLIWYECDAKGEEIEMFYIIPEW